MITKTCFKCGKEKPLDEFYKHPQMAGGNTEKMQGKIYMSGNDFERLLASWEKSNRKRRAAA